MQRLTDLREILHYVPQFRDRVFVIAPDGEVAVGDNFANLLLDVALLRSLRVGVVLAHGAGHRLQELGRRLHTEPSDTDGGGVTDAATLGLARLASGDISQDLLTGLAATDLRAAVSNAVVAHPAGILGGVDRLWTGRVERIDVDLLRSLLANDIIPILPPLGTDGEGHTYRLNSDAVAAEAARALGAAKLIYLTTAPGVELDGKLIRQLDPADAERLAAERGGELPAGVLSKLRHAVRAARAGVPRVHVIDGRVQEGLLAEVFSQGGVGTLVHTNEYQAIRQATMKDLLSVYALLQQGMETDELLRRTRDEIEACIDDFFVFEVDQSPVACGAIHLHEGGVAELACLYVAERFAGRGVGARLIQYAERRASEAGAASVICLSTQAINYFVHKAGYRVGTPDDLPPRRRERYDASGRLSRVLVKGLVGS